MAKNNEFAEMLENYLTEKDFENAGKDIQNNTVCHPNDEDIDLAMEKLEERAKTSKARKNDYHNKLRRMKLNAIKKARKNRKENIMDVGEQKNEENARLQMREYYVN